MLNRTNRTLSANPNRLNLGTRNLVALATGNNGTLALRTAHAFSTSSVRAGFVEYPGIPVEGPPIGVMPKPMKPAMPAMPGSSPRSSGESSLARPWDQGQADQSPQRQSSQDHPRTSLGWHCDPAGRAGRSARAARALVTRAASSS